MKRKHNFRECPCCDYCKHWGWKDDRMTMIECEKLGIDITGESCGMICDLYEEEDFGNEEA